MKRIVQINILAATLFYSQSQVFADMFFKDRSDELYEQTGSPLLRNSIRAANEAMLREIVREEVKRQLAERDRHGEFEEERLNTIQSQRDTEGRQNEAYRQCVQSTDVRAYLDCY